MYPAITDFRGSELLRAIDRHMSGAFSAALCFVPDAEWHEDGDYSALVTGLPHPFGNLIWNAHLGGESIEQQIHAVLAPIKKHNVPAAWIAGPASQPANLGERLAEQGFFLESNMPGMAMDLAALQPTPLPPGTTIAEVTEAEAMREWIQTLSVGYEIPDVVAECFAHWPAHLGYSAQSPMRAFLVRQDEKPAGCSILYLNDGLAGIYCVATRPEARRQGIGRLATGWPLLLAREMGYRTGVLQASAMGYPVYCKMGFEEFGKIQMYIRMPHTGA